MDGREISHAILWEITSGGAIRAGGALWRTYDQIYLCLGHQFFNIEFHSSLTINSLTLNFILARPSIG
jgi:hypothetical protein